jgi:acyl-CoA reductase-like NAD-dependent aldehyde dehydrogenase
VARDDAGERAEALLKLAAAIDDNTEELAELESQNVGKPLGYARDEMPVSADNLRFFAGAARVLEGKSAGEYMRGYTSMIRREPVGIVGGIAPWNYPLMMAVWKIGPALAAATCRSSSRPSRRRCRRCASPSWPVRSCPPGVLNVITGDGEPVGAGIVRHPDVRMVSLTGDCRDRQGDRPHGRGHAQARAPRARRQGAGDRLRRRRPGRRRGGIKIAGYWNSGQDCTAASRVVAGPKIYDKLLDELVPLVEGLHVGDPAEGDEIEMGPVISKSQQERVLGFLDRAKGAKVLTGRGNERRPRLLRQADR